MNPFDRRLWASAWYLLAYLGVASVLFCTAFATATTAAALAWTLLGLPLLIAAAATIRGCANVERTRTGRFLGETVTGSYRDLTQLGTLARARACWKDPATWRDTAYLVGMFIPLLVLDTIVLSVWLVLLAGVTLPVWYWLPWQTFGHGQTVHGAQLGYFPNGPHGHPGYGFYVDSLPRALIAAAVFLILFVLFSRVLVLTARAHALVARALLNSPTDPLAEAKEVLSRPGPLTPLHQNGRVLYVPRPRGSSSRAGTRRPSAPANPREATMRQSQNSVLPETNHKGKQPGGSPRLAALMGLAGVAMVVMAIALMASAAPARVPVHQAPVPVHSAALVQGRVS